MGWANNKFFINFLIPENVQRKKLRRGKGIEEEKKLKLLGKASEIILS